MKITCPCCKLGVLDLKITRGRPASHDSPGESDEVDIAERSCECWDFLMEDAERYWEKVEETAFDNIHQHYREGEV